MVNTLNEVKNPQANKKSQTTQAKWEGLLLKFKDSKCDTATNAFTAILFLIPTFSMYGDERD